MKLHKKLLCSAGVALLLSSTSLYAAGESARDIINNAYHYIGTMDKYAFTAHVTEKEAEESNQHTVSVKIDRPDKFRVDNKGTVKNRSSYLNNGNFTMYDKEYKFYGKVKTGKGIDGSLDVLFEDYAIKAPLAQLMYSDMEKRVKFKSNKYFGTRNLAGVECDYVAFKNATREIHVWVATGDQPLLRAYSIIDTSTEPASRIDTTLTWNIHPNISDRDFVFVAPNGSSEITVDDNK